MSTRILSWNVNGIRAVGRKGFVPWVLAENPDILCVQETKADPAQLDGALTAIPGYRSYWAWSTVRKGYSGVAVYTKREPVSVERGLGVERFDREGRTLILDYGDFVLYNVYFPNGKRDTERLRYKMEFYDEFLAHCTKLRRRQRRLIMCGDYNTAHAEIDLANPKENAKVSGFLPEERAWIDKYISKGYVDTFRQFVPDGAHYTWWDMKSRARERNVGWRIDYFFVSDNLSANVKHAFIMPEVMGSDHCPVGIEVEV